MREGLILRVGEDGQLVEDREQVEALVESKARRICYSRGFFPETTKAIRALGHSDYRLTMNVYTHVDLAMQEEPVQLLDGFFRKNNNPRVEDDGKG